MLKLEQAKPLIDWINERHAIYLRKALLSGEEVPEWANPLRSGGPKPGYSLDHLTDDPILREYRFCNVFRELDRVTVWIRKNIREPFADNEHLWFMLAIARFINWPPTLERLIESPDGWPFDPRFSPERMTMVLEEWKARGEKVETGAYMIRAESDQNKEWYSWSKQRYISEIVLGRAWEMRDIFRAIFEHEQMSLVQAFHMFRDQPAFVGWGPFMTHQVIVDLRWTRYLENAPDVGRWASVGPGSARGLNRLHGRPFKQAVSQERALDEMLELSELIHQPGVLGPHVPPIELADIQNCLCETDKWLRAKNNEGRPRSRYVPGRGS